MLVELADDEPDGIGPDVDGRDGLHLRIRSRPKGHCKPNINLTDH